MNIMILGAGIYQLPLIKKAKKMGHKVYVVSPDGKYPGIEEADVWVNSDTREKNYILQVAKKANIDGVVTTGTDVAVPTIGFLIDNLGLSGTGYNASKISMNKFLMKKCFIENGVNTADFMIVSSKEKMVDAVEVIGLPVMVKAIDSSGSRGITKVDNIGDLGRAYDDAISVSQEKEVIVEKFLQGKEIGAQAIVGNGKLKGVLLHDDLVTPPPVSVPIGHSMPITLEEQLITAIETQIMLAVSSIGIKETIANVDIMISEGKPYLLEIGARMGATCLPENVSIYTGIDIYEHLVLEALGQNPSFVNPKNGIANAAVLVRSDKDGIVNNIHIPESVYSNPWLENVSIDVSVGDSVKQFRVGPDRIGQVIVRGNSSEHAHEIAQYILSEIDIEVI